MKIVSIVLIVLLGVISSSSSESEHESRRDLKWDEIHNFFMTLKKNRTTTETLVSPTVSLTDIALNALGRRTTENPMVQAQNGDIIDDANDLNDYYNDGKRILGMTVGIFVLIIVLILVVIIACCVCICRLCCGCCVREKTIVVPFQTQVPIQPPIQMNFPQPMPNPAGQYWNNAPPPAQYSAGYEPPPKYDQGIPPQNRGFDPQARMDYPASGFDNPNYNPGSASAPSYSVGQKS